jgi:hypothetical protein
MPGEELLGGAGEAPGRIAVAGQLHLGPGDVAGADVDFPDAHPRGLDGEPQPLVARAKIAALRRLSVMSRAIVESWTLPSGRVRASVICDTGITRPPRSTKIVSPDQTPSRSTAGQRHVHPLRPRGLGPEVDQVRHRLVGPEPEHGAPRPGSCTRRR